MCLNNCGSAANDEWGLLMGVVPFSVDAGRRVTESKAHGGRTYVHWADEEEPKEQGCCCYLALKRLGVCLGLAARPKKPSENIARATSAHWIRMITLQPLDKPFGRENWRDLKVLEVASERLLRSLAQTKKESRDFAPLCQLNGRLHFTRFLAELWNKVEVEERKALQQLAMEWEKDSRQLQSLFFRAYEWLYHAPIESIADISQGRGRIVRGLYSLFRGSERWHTPYNEFLRVLAVKGNQVMGVPEVASLVEVSSLSPAQVDNFLTSSEDVPAAVKLSVAIRETLRQTGGVQESFFRNRALAFYKGLSAEEAQSWGEMETPQVRQCLQSLLKGVDGTQAQYLGQSVQAFLEEEECLRI